jgi:hypothetical protein
MTLQRRRPQARPYQVEFSEQVKPQWAEGRLKVLGVASKIDNTNRLV